jgi:hypothetical protein
MLLAFVSWLSVNPAKRPVARVSRTRPLLSPSTTSRFPTLASAGQRREPSYQAMSPSSALNAFRTAQFIALGYTKYARPSRYHGQVLILSRPCNVKTLR